MVHPVLPVFRYVLCDRSDLLRVCVLKDFTCGEIIVRVSEHAYIPITRSENAEHFSRVCSFVLSLSPPRDRYGERI